MEVGNIISGRPRVELPPIEKWLIEAGIVLSRVEREAGIEHSEDQAQRDQIVHPILASLRDGEGGGILSILRKARRNDIVGEIESLEEITLNPAIPMSEAAVRWETAAHVVAESGEELASELMDDLCEGLCHGVNFDREMTKRGGLDGVRATNPSVIRERLLSEAKAGAREVSAMEIFDSDEDVMRILEHVAHSVGFIAEEVEHDASAYIPP